MNKFSAEDSFGKVSYPLGAKRKIWAVNALTSRKGRKMYYTSIAPSRDPEYCAD